MRRALASLLLTLFSLPLIVPVVRANADGTVPACCRREGKHHCAMGSASSDVPNAPATGAIQPKCPYYPATVAIPGASNAALLNDSHAIGASLLRYSAKQTQTEARYRVSFSRSRQKRGPPARLS